MSDLFFSDIYITLYNNKQHDIENLNEELLDKNINNKTLNNDDQDLLYFDLKKFIIKTMKSYNYDINKIMKQFCIDCPRSNIIINNIKITNNNIVSHINEINDKLIYFYDENNNFNHITNKNLIYMLCCQSSYAYSYYYINNYYGDINNNIIVFCLEKNRKIEMKITNNKIYFSLVCIFEIKNILKDIKIHKIETLLDFELDYNNFEISNIESNGIFIWNVI